MGSPRGRHAFKRAAGRPAGRAFAAAVAACAAAAVVSVADAGVTTASRVSRFGAPASPPAQYFKTDAVFKLAKKWLSVEGSTKLSGTDATAAAEACIDGIEIAVVPIGFEATEKFPNRAVLNDMALEAVHVCGYVPSTIRLRKLHMGVRAALWLSTKPMTATADDADKAPSPWQDEYYSFDDKLTAAAILALKKLEPCSDDAPSSSGAEVATSCRVDYVKSRSQLPATKIEDVPMPEVPARFRDASVRGAGRVGEQAVLSAADEADDDNAALLEVGVDAHVSRPAWATPDPAFEGNYVRFAIFGCPIWRVPLEGKANCYAYATVTPYTAGHVNRRYCHPGRAGGAALAWPNDIWGVPVVGGQINLATFINAYANPGFPAAGSLLINHGAMGFPAAFTARCTMLTNAMQADGMLAVAPAPLGARHEVEPYVHYIVNLSPRPAPPVGAAYHVVGNNNVLARLAAGAPQPVNSVVVFVTFDFVDYHFHRRNADVLAAATWSDKNGATEVHGTQTTAIANDNNFQARSYVNLRARLQHVLNVAAAVGDNNVYLNYGRPVTVGTAACGTRYAVPLQAASNANGGPVGNANECA